MKQATLFLTKHAVLMGLVAGCGIRAADLGLAEEKPDWPSFIRRHDLAFDRLPGDWTQAPHFGNAMLGSMLYQEGNAIQLQVFRADVQDHRDDTHGWKAYSRPRLPHVAQGQQATQHRRPAQVPLEGGDRAPARLCRR